MTDIKVTAKQMKKIKMMIVKRINAQKTLYKLNAELIALSIGLAIISTQINIKEVKK